MVWPVTAQTGAILAQLSPEPSGSGWVWDPWGRTAGGLAAGPAPSFNSGTPTLSSARLLCSSDLRASGRRGAGRRARIDGRSWGGISIPGAKLELEGRRRWRRRRAQPRSGGRASSGSCLGDTVSCTLSGPVLSLCVLKRGCDAYDPLGEEHTSLVFSDRPGHRQALIRSRTGWSWRTPGPMGKEAPVPAGRRRMARGGWP
ncbi:uncharacterized protein [Globicephala melas]|uniref:uncharacterized protein n=1 Tax=Globicephala melas TaxID=9731 RepID=UPI00293D371D|nr:uncharacterized protein LOC115848698 [Globicephala melas]